MSAIIYLVAAFLASTGVYLIFGAVHDECFVRRPPDQVDDFQPQTVGEQAEAWLRRQ